MTIVSEFMIAPADALDRCALSGDHGSMVPAVGRMESVTYRGFTPLVLGWLWACLLGEMHGTHALELEPVGNGPSGEPTVDRLPDPFVGLLAGIEDEQIGPVSAKWGASEELACGREVLVPVLRTLRRLARTSMASGRSLCLRTYPIHVRSGVWPRIDDDDLADDAATA